MRARLGLIRLRVEGLRVPVAIQIGFIRTEAQDAVDWKRHKTSTVPHPRFTFRV